ILCGLNKSLHSFTTRRSSDLLRADRESMALQDAIRSLIYIGLAYALLHFYLKEKMSKTMLVAGIGLLTVIDLLPVAHRYLNKERSEEHTSELQSRENLVCRLL